jgi:salicylate hydroxylase
MAELIAMTRQNITIVGAGIAGLATALGLGRAGHEVTIFEQTAEFSPIGAGLQLGPNAVRALRKLGVWEAVEPYTTSPSAIEMRDGVTGRLLRALPLGRSFETRFGEPYRVIHRADLHAALLSCVEYCPTVQLKMGTQFAGDADVVIGADGVRSPLRTQMFGGKAVSHKATFYRAMGYAEDDRVTLLLFPGAHVVAYTVGQARKLNVIAVIDQSPSEAADWATPVSGQDLVKHLKGETKWHGLLSALESWTSWPALTAPALATWHKGNTCLIGDAAHGCLPYLAQGAAMALEDAVTMRDSFAGRSYRDAFVVFEQMRKKRATRMTKVSQQQVMNYHARGILRHARNQVLRHLPDAMLMQRLNWIYDYIV